jgi:uncharacterized membrane protein
MNRPTHGFRGFALVTRITNRIVFCAGAVTVIAGHAGNALSQCTSYDIEVIEAQSCSLGIPLSIGFSINEQGRICGYYDNCAGVEYYQAFAWFGTFPYAAITMPLPFLEGRAYAINDKDEIVGLMDANPLPVHAFFLQKGVVSMLALLPGKIDAEAFSINNQSQIVGYCGGAGLTATLWQDGKAIDLEIPVGPSTVARDINESGQIVGWMGVAPGPPFPGEAFLWDGGKTTPLGFPNGATNSEAWSINNHGDICGAYIYPNPNQKGSLTRAILWSKGQMIDLGTVGGHPRSGAFDISDAGEIVGECWGNPAVPEKGFIWRDGVMTALDDLLPPGTSVISIPFATAINNVGQITGYCQILEKNGLSQHASAFVMTPIPPIPGDFNCNKIVDVDDLLAVINRWNYQGAPGIPADFNSDGIVGSADLMIVIDNWTK